MKLIMNMQAQSDYHNSFANDDYGANIEEFHSSIHPQVRDHIVTRFHRLLSQPSPVHSISLCSHSILPYNSFL
jgi:hypothetical protein